MAVSVLSGKEVFVTAGSTRAYLDAVRYISNRSSGRLGALIAAELLRRGAYVTYFHGFGAQTPRIMAFQGKLKLPEKAFDRLELIEIETIPQLVSALEMELKDGDYDVAIHAMAVLDFIPDLSSVRTGKTKSDEKEWEIKLVRTPKVIDMIKKISPNTTLVGFKLEVQQTREVLIASAQKLMKQSGAQLVVGNDLVNLKEGEYQGVLIGKGESGQDCSTQEIEGREAMAIALCDQIEEILKKKQG